MQPGARLRVAPRSGPAALDAARIDATAEIVTMDSGFIAAAGPGNGAAAGVRRLGPAQVGTYARSVPAGRPVVVVGADDERAAAVAERLAALGVDAGWLVGGWDAWNGAERAVEAR